MENEITNKSNFLNNVENFIKNNIKILITFVIIIFLCFIGAIYFNSYKENQNKKISEEYIKAGIMLTQNKKDKAKDIYKDIILTKNKFYSYLALNNIIENELIRDNNEILQLFEVLEKINNDKEQKNLIKLKKALFLIQISKENEAMQIFDYIISSDSIWKEIAMEFSKTN